MFAAKTRALLVKRLLPYSCFTNRRTAFSIYRTKIGYLLAPCE